MAWCCTHVRKGEAEAVEIKIKHALDSTEAWVARCRQRRAQNAKQRILHQKRRKKLEESRTELLADKVRAEEELARVQGQLNAIATFFTKLEEAEAELARVEAELDDEEGDMIKREQAVKDHLSSIQSLTGTVPAGKRTNSPTTPSPPPRPDCSPPATPTTNTNTTASPVSVQLPI